MKKPKRGKPIHAIKWPKSKPKDPRDMLRPNWAGQFDTFDDWVNWAQRRIGTGVGPESAVKGHFPEAICIDSKGRRCNIGGDFHRARDDKAFPVYYFWNCERSKK